MTGESGNRLLFAVNLSEIDRKNSGTAFAFRATEQQCLEMANRFGCVGIDDFQIDAKVTPLRKEGQYRISGSVEARVFQNCVVSLEPVVSTIRQELDLILLPEDQDVSQELRLEDDDFETYSGDIVDLGEVGAVELALAIDPYPRAPNVSLTELGPGTGDNVYEVQEEGDVGRNRPFEALAAIKGKS